MKQQEIIETIDRNITAFLKSRGSSMTWLASQLGITTASLQNKRNGRTDWKWSEILKLCEVLDVTPDALSGIKAA